MRKYLSLEFGIPSCGNKNRHKNKTNFLKRLLFKVVKGRDILTDVGEIRNS